jgi:hypothetical protein
MSEIRLPEHLIQRIERRWASNFERLDKKRSGKQLAQSKGDRERPAAAGDHEDPFKSRIVSRWITGSLLLLRTTPGAESHYAELTRVRRRTSA